MNIREQMLQNNPFTNGCAGDPWSEHHPSVDSINQDIFVQIMNLIRQKKNEPGLPLASLVLGDAGMGKTFFLKRILDELRRNEPKISLVFVQDILNPQTPMQRLLNEVVTCLDKKSGIDGNFSQLDQLLADLQCEFLYTFFRENPSAKKAKGNAKILQKLHANPMEAMRLFKPGENNEKTLKEELIPWFREHFRELETSLLPVLFQYQDPTKRAIARDWLRGCILDESECKKLGVNERDPHNIGALEDESRRIIISLGRLFEYIDRSIVVCFDQLDALKTETIDTFGDMVHLLVNSVRSMLPIAFVQLENWESKFTHTLRVTARQRLEMNRFPLSGCSISQAQKLIELRIRETFANTQINPDPLCRWMLDQLTGKIGVGDTPRIVIQTACRVIQGTFDSPIDGTTETIENQDLTPWYTQESERILSEWDTQHPDAEKLQRALETWLESQNFRPEPVNSKDTHFLAICGTLPDPDGNDIPIAFSISTIHNGASISATLRRCIQFLEKNAHSQCYFITDARCGLFPLTWRKTNELREKFEQAGGRVIILSQAKVVKWFALYALQNRIHECDITVNMRTATMEDLYHYIQNSVSLIDTNQDPTSIDLITTPLPENIAELINHSVQSSPMNTLMLNTFIKQLEQNNIDITQSQLIDYISDHLDEYTLIPNRDSYMISRNIGGLS